MSTIFPGNYVAHLNAYREQGVEAIPGVEFYKGVGALVLNPDTKGVTDRRHSCPLVLTAFTSCLLTCVKMTSPAWISPSWFPAGSVVYRTAISAPGVREDTAAVAGTTTVVLETSG